MEVRFRLIGTPDKNLPDSSLSILTGTGFSKTEIIMGSVNSVLFSNKLEIISDDSLKYLLTSYPAVVDRFREQEETTMRILLDLHRPILEKSFSLLSWLADDPDYPDLKNGLAPNQLRSLLSDRNYQNAIFAQYYHTSLTRYRADDLKERTEQIIRMINLNSGIE